MMKQFATLTAALALLAGANILEAAEPISANTKTAIFAGGCFWCIQTPYDKAKGVIKTVVGYTGGSEAVETAIKMAKKYHACCGRPCVNASPESRPVWVRKTRSCAPGGQRNSAPLSGMT